MVIEGYRDPSLPLPSYHIQWLDNLLASGPLVISFSSQDVCKAKWPELVAFTNVELGLELNPTK